MKYNIGISEKKRILEMHSKEKKFLIKEQNEDLYDRLQSFINNGYIKKPASVVKMNSTKPDLAYAIKKESTKTPGTFKYFFIDGRVGGMVDGKFTFEQKPWNVGEYNRFLKNKEIETKNTENTAEITKLKGEGWKTESELAQIPKEQLNNPNLYLKNTEYGVTLYKSKTEENRPGGYTERQKSFLQTYRNSGLHPKNEFPNEIHTTLDCQTPPNYEGLFPKGFEVCRDPNSGGKLPKYYAGDERDTVGNSEIPNKSESSATNEEPKTKNELKQSIESMGDPEFAKQMMAQTKKKDFCRVEIKKFYQAWRNKMVITDAAFRNQKSLTQECVNQHRFEGLGGLFGKTDNYIRALTGRGKPGEGPAPKNKFRLDPPND